MRLHLRWIPSFAGLCCLTLANTLIAGDWGTIRGRIELDGEPPQLAPLVQGGAPVRGCAVRVPDESLIVDPQSHGIANVMIYLRSRPERVVPDQADTQRPAFKLEQRGCRYVPHVAIIQTGQPIEVKNLDAQPHNLRVEPFKNPRVNLLVQPQNNPLQVGPFQVAEPSPVSVACDIQPWMKAWWVVVDHPYAAVTGADGSFQIKDLPVGEHEFRVWHERAGYVNRSLKVVVAADTTVDVPTIKLPVKTLLEPK